MKSTQPKELDWSWERSSGWRGQIHRCRRWRKRLATCASSADTETTFDFILAYFIASYHVRDWLARSSDIEAGAVEELFRDNVALRLCADIANIAKHYELDKRPRRKYQISFAREYVGEQQGWFGGDSALRILSLGESFDVLTIIDECESAWQGFFLKHGLLQRDTVCTRRHNADEH